jgi:hypothetical protein
VTTIDYTEPIEDLIEQLSATKHVTHQSFKKTSVTIHHNGGLRNSRQDVLDTWKIRAASAHFDVDVNGAIAQFVKVDEYAWAVDDLVGNETSISIEMADATGSPSWQISDATLNSTARLAAWLYKHVIGARPASNNFFPHQHWSQTDCPGPFVMHNFSLILSKVQAQYDLLDNIPPHLPGKLTIVQVAHQVIQGQWGNGGDRVVRLNKAGYDAAEVQAELNLEMTGHSGRQTKTISQLASEVINGEWGNDPARKQKLTAAGYNYALVQAEVNRREA